VENTKTWDLIHTERAVMVKTLEGLTAEQWSKPSLCGGWSVRVTAAHIVIGAEQTAGHFFARMAANGFNFNAMMDRDARRLGASSPEEIVGRLQARTTTTNHPPAPVGAMLGEIVVHGEDIRRPLGLASEAAPAAVAACLTMFAKGGFPLGGKKRVAGLRLVATDLDWSHGSGPEVSGPAVPLLLAVTGRHAGLDDLTGGGLDVLRGRMAPAS
jgi:uncharacterized protein (TIGR03083 family)